MIDPNNANGAADALTPEAPSEYSAEQRELNTSHVSIDDLRSVPEYAAQREQGYSDEHADDEEIVRQLRGDMPDESDVETSATRPADPVEAITPRITGDFINQMLRLIRAPFEAKKKRGAAFKGQRTKLDKLADQAVRTFRAESLPELTEEQALRISLGITGLAGDSYRGFTYVDSDEG